MDLGSELRPGPLDSGVEDRDHRIRPAPVQLPGARRIEAGDLRLTGIRSVAVNSRAPASLRGPAEETEGLVVDAGVADVVRIVGLRPVVARVVRRVVAVRVGDPELLLGGGGRVVRGV